MEGSSDLRPHSTVDGRHLAAIEDARRQFEQAAKRLPGSSAALGIDRNPSPSLEWLTDSLPGYEIGPEIHRGGQGVVYRSVQRGTQREVAIKVMREGPFGGPRDKARFEREIQILGQFKHPNIVTIHDSGSSAHGFYFVMDYIPGESLDAYVAKSNLGVRETLALFAKICHAVHAAHLHGVIHRDLKPANIRVDEAGEPHLLDFGLAKLNEDEMPTAESSALRSMTGQFIGSMPWASPEQIEGKPGEIDVRTDVYSLGVMLFQVLTGQPPYKVGGNMRQAVENICHVDPPSPGSIRAEVGSEVDAIVLKCLCKKKDDRYQSAWELARDIERYLSGEPVEARRGGGWYVLSKQVRKHRLAVSVAGILIGVIAAGLVTSLTFWRQAVRSRDAAQWAKIAAESARDEARKQETTANAVTRFLTHDVLIKLDPYNTQGEDLTARALFEQAAADVEAGAFKDQPLVEFEIRTVLGLVYLWMSDSLRAEAQFRPALAIARRELGDESEKTVLTMGRLGTVLSKQGRLEEAERLLRQALEIQSRTRGDDDLTTVMSRSSLAGWYLDADRPAEAEVLYREVLDARIRLQGPEHPDTLAVQSKLAGALMAQRKFSESEEIYLEVIRLKRRLHGDQHPETLLDLMHFANMLHFAGKYEEALPIAKEAFDGLIERMGRAHESTQSALMVLAKIHQSMGEWSEAESLLRESLDYYRASGRVRYQVVEILRQLAVNLTRLGKLAEAETVLRDALKELDKIGGHAEDRLHVLSYLVNALGEQGKSEEAISFAKECVQLGRQTYGADSETTIIFINNYAFALLGMGRASEAEELFREALESQKRTSGEDNALALNLMHNLALALGNQGKQAEMESLLRAALKGRRQLLDDSDPLTLKTMHALATVLRDLGKNDEAESLFREALDRAEKVWPNGHYLTEHFRRGLGVQLTALHRYEEAETLLLLSHERDLSLLSAGHPNLVEGVEKLVELYEAWGKEDRAAEWRAKLPQNSTTKPASISPAR